MRPPGSYPAWLLAALGMVPQEYLTLVHQPILPEDRQH